MSGALVAIGEGLGELSLANGGPGGGRGGDATAATPGGPGPTALTLASGGDAANVATMAARLGADARLAGRVGDDGVGRWLLTAWRAAGIDVGGVRVDADAATGLYLNEAADGGRGGEPAAAGHRFTYWRTGSAGSHLEPDDLDAGLLASAAVLVATGVTLAISRSSARAVAHAVAAARAAGGRVACVLNHRPALGGDVAELAELARGSDVVIGSREDAQAVFGTGEAAALRAQLSGGSVELVLTDGGAPAVALAGDAGWTQAAPAVPVRNAGGAGDALAGAYLAMRLGGEPVARALAWGVAAASLSVQHAGCASAYPRADAVAAMVDELPAAVPLERGAVR